MHSSMFSALTLVLAAFFLAGCRDGIDLGLGRDDMVREIELAEYKWKNRLLLVFAPDSESRFVQQQKEMLAGEAAGMRDRDLMTFYLFDGEPGRLSGRPVAPEVTGELRDQLNVPSGFSVVLVGKDGTVKMRSGDPVPADDIFSKIDAMPMRRAELRERGEL